MSVWVYIRILVFIPVCLLCCVLFVPEEKGKRVPLVWEIGMMTEAAL